MRREVLRAENIRKVINGSPILEGLSLSVYEREILGMTGLSGSGKSVIGEILSGIRTCDSGQIWMSGERLEASGIKQAAEKGVYHIKAEPALFSCLSMEENICLTEKDFLGSAYFPHKRQTATVREALRSLDIRMDTRASVKDLTLWERHQVEILRAYYLHAKLIIIDNITNDYTEEEFRKLGALLLRLKHKGVSILLIESMPERVLSFTDRLVILRNGRDEGILFREEYEIQNIRKIMMGDYSVPETIEKAMPDREKGVLLSARGISGRKLKNLSFTLKKGEVIGFLDEEKIICTDVLHLFMGKEEPISGAMLLEGNAVNVKAGRGAMIRAGFGYVDDYRTSIFPKLSFRDNLTITSLDRLTFRTAINAKLERMVVCDLLRRLNIPLEYLKKPIKDVGNKEQLTAALYKWILNRSKVVVLNNVLSGTDMIMRNIVVRFLNELREKEFGAILFSPNTREIYELCDRVYIMKEGRLIREQTGNYSAMPSSCFQKA
ncbi:ATP-binding cassette domain-containing protein [Lacrimispora sp. 210928-DFI.3.58]|uniref:ATP-binding cassette domain-containing protein n=1 Tax=Lacrimispora sp. 210928-DFI.3.58 TaxID=2883214 RepID=UPI0015B3FFDF|nr:ATP-binding cassette domain-containing protein [Lacrimispora sp. 210928-DFI.3.58]MCB7317423.1 ATP-binding cassette domain-containing protein [Lacrimispora sp. 210928-DFI.3.58]